MSPPAVRSPRSPAWWPPPCRGRRGAVPRGGLRVGDLFPFLVQRERGVRVRDRSARADRRRGRARDRSRGVQRGSVGGRARSPSSRQVAEAAGRTAARPSSTRLRPAAGSLSTRPASTTWPAAPTSGCSRRAGPASSPCAPSALASSPPTLRAGTRARIPGPRCTRSRSPFRDARRLRPVSRLALMGGNGTRGRAAGRPRRRGDRRASVGLADRLAARWTCPLGSAIVSLSAPGAPRAARAGGHQGERSRRWVRLGFHLYNDEEDADAVVAALAD